MSGHPDQFPYIDNGRHWQPILLGLRNALKTVARLWWPGLQILGLLKERKLEKGLLPPVLLMLLSMEEQRQVVQAALCCFEARVPMRQMMSPVGPK
jgi:hypothetical protein